MLKKILSFSLAICMLLCNIAVLGQEDATTDVIYDMQKKGTWVGTNASVYGTDSTRFPARGEVIRTSVKKGVGVTLYDAFEQPIKTGRVKISFDFYADEDYVGYPEFYFSIANMDPVDLTKLWNSSPTFYPRADGNIQYYGGYGTNGAIWTVSDTDATFEKGIWYTVESIVNFDEKGKIQGYLDGEKLYEVGGATTITGLIFNISGKDTSNGKLYFDNIVVSEVKDNLSASFAYGEGDNVVIEFTQPISAENAQDVKAINLLTGEITEILEIKQIASNRVSYKMPSGLPYAEYQFTFGEKNVSDFGSSITGSINVNGTVGMPEKYVQTVQTDSVLIEDKFNSYKAMEHAAATWTPDSECWEKVGDSWWGMGPLINDNEQLQIHTFYGDRGSESGVKGKILSTPQKNGRFTVSYDLSFDEYDANEQNAVRMDVMVGNEAFPILEVRGESVSVYPTQTKEETPVEVTQVTKVNDATAWNYKIALDFENEKILITIGDVVLSDLKMSDALKTTGVQDIVFMGCRNVENGSEEECNCALIDNFSASRAILEYTYPPAVAGVRFVESNETERTLMETISPLTEMVKVKFSKPVNKKDLEKITITNDRGEVSYTGNWDSENNTWEMLIPEREFKVKSRHILYVPLEIYDSNGLALPEAYTGKFMVGANTRSVTIGYINEFIAGNQKQDLALLLTEDYESLGVASAAFEIADKTALAEEVIAYAAGQPLADSDDTVKVMQKLVLMECANNQRVTNLWEKDYGYGISDQRIVTVFEERFGEFVTEKISEQNFVATDIDEFDDALRDAVILTAIRYADGQEQVENVLDSFAIEIGEGESLDISDEICEAVYETASFTSVSELKKFIKNYTPPVTEPGKKPSSRPGGGGGGGFVSKPTSSAEAVADNKGYENKNDNTKEETPIFSDIADYPWAEEAINELFAKGVIVGRGNNLFVPDANVLREETAKIIVEAFRFYIKGSIEFNDVKTEDWFFPYIARAYNSGVISGISEHEFGSGQMILRQDLAVMVYNALKAADALKADKSIKQLFIDDENISDYAVEAVYYLKEVGILSGDENGAFNPKSYASRAETAKIVYLATQYLK